MIIREYLARNQKIVSAAALVVIVVGFWSLLGQLAGSAASGRQVGGSWFYDLNDKSLFVMSGNVISPVRAPNDGEQPPFSGVRAHVFACGSCGDQNKRFIGYLEMYTDEAGAALDTLRERMNDLHKQGKFYDPSGDAALMALEQTIDEGRMVRRPDDTRWHRDISAEGEFIVASVPRDCGSEPVVACLPPQR